MNESQLLRHSTYFAGSIFVTLEFANFPLAVFEDWKDQALAITVVNASIFMIAFGAGLLALRILRTRRVAFATLVAAGVVSALELVQFTPFAFP